MSLGCRLGLQIHQGCNRTDLWDVMDKRVLSVEASASSSSILVLARCSALHTLGEGGVAESSLVQGCFGKKMGTNTVTSQWSLPARLPLLINLNQKSLNLQPSKDLNDAIVHVFVR